MACPADLPAVSSLLAFGVIAMITADAVVGVRLLRLAWRTRELPEAALGSAFVLLGAVGYPLATAARRGAFGSASGNAAWMAGALLAQDAACLAVYAYTARTFRRGRRWAAGIVGVALGCLLVSWLGQAVTTAFAPNQTCGAYTLGLVTRGLAFAWASAESCRQYALARRRLRLGLASPLVVDRFLLFAIATAGVFSAFALFLGAQLTATDVAKAPWLLGTTSVVGVVTAVTTWLAFLPPEPYRRRVLRRAA
jgi:hypothetical protein